MSQWLLGKQEQRWEQVRHSSGMARQGPEVRDGPRIGWDITLQAGSHGWAGLWQSWREALLQRCGAR